MQELVIPTIDHSQETVSTADEKEHLANCHIKRSQSASIEIKPIPTSEILIPCEICREQINLENYEEHLNEHKANLKQIEEEKIAACTVPCEVCKFPILFSEYEAHIKTHDNPPEPKIEAQQIIEPSIEPSVPEPYKATFPSVKERFTTQSTGNIIFEYAIDSLSKGITCKKCGKIVKVVEILRHLRSHSLKLEENEGLISLKIRN